MFVWLENKIFKNENEKYEINRCNTMCCLLGFATMLPEFQAEGLETNGSIPMFYNSKSDSMVGGVDAGAAFLGLDYRDAEILFIPEYYPEDCKHGENAKQEILRRLDHLIAGGASLEKFVPDQDLDDDPWDDYPIDELEGDQV